MNKTNIERIRPFHCGSQDTDWQDANCCKCSKFESDTGYSSCDIDQALLKAYLDDGTVSADIAKRMGYEKTDSPRYCWPCPEKDPPWRNKPSPTQCENQPEIHTEGED